MDFWWFLCKSFKHWKSFHILSGPKQTFKMLFLRRKQSLIFPILYPFQKQQNFTGSQYVKQNFTENFKNIWSILYNRWMDVLIVQICPTCVRVGAFSAGCFTAKHLTMLGLFGVPLSTRRAEKKKWKMMNMGVYLLCPNNCMSQCFRERTRELSIIRNMKPDSLGLTHSFTLLESLQFQKEHWDTGSRLLLCGSMQLAAFTYTFLLSWRRLGIRGMQCGRLSASDRENIECDICGKQQPTCG